MPVTADLLQVDKLRRREMNSLTEDNATSLAPDQVEDKNAEA